MRTTFIGLLLAAGLSSACATSPALIRARLDPYVGQPVTVLIGQWGPPSGVFPLPDLGVVYSWLYTTAPTTTTNTFYYPAIHTAQSNTFSEGSFCRFDWTTTAAGTIVGYRWDGSCKVELR